MNTKPCLDCQDRRLHCHSTCEKYQQVKKVYNQSECEYVSYKYEKHVKFLRNKARQWGR